MIRIERRIGRKVGERLLVRIWRKRLSRGLWYRLGDRRTPTSLWDSQYFKVYTGSSAESGAESGAGSSPKGK
jgi:hypothetical protein